NVIDRLLVGITFSSSLIVVAAYALSACSLLAHAWSWIAAGWIVPILALSYGSLLGWPEGRALSDAAARASPHPTRFLRWAAICAGVAIALVAVMNLLIVLFTAPHNGDAMTYRLTRMAYYLQFGSLAWYPATYWTQVEHPKVDVILNLAFFLGSG